MRVLLNLFIKQSSEKGGGILVSKDFIVYLPRFFCHILVGVLIQNFQLVLLNIMQ